MREEAPGEEDAGDDFSLFDTRCRRGCPIGLGARARSTRVYGRPKEYGGSLPFRENDTLQVVLQANGEFENEWHF